MIVTGVARLNDSNSIIKIEKNHNIVFYTLLGEHVKIIHDLIDIEKNRIYKIIHRIAILCKLSNRIFIIKEFVSAGVKTNV